MRGVNKILLIGNATRDAELRHTHAGKPVASLRLATHRRSGEGEVTQYHSIVCWDTLAETTSTYVKKGDPLYVEGRLEYRTFQDDEGKERGVAEIIASDVQFLGRKPTAAEPVESGPPADTITEDVSLDDLDIPF
jgi:single-strand DNA-binding protein